MAKAKKKKVKKNKEKKDSKKAREEKSKEKRDLRGKISELKEKIQKKESPESEETQEIGERGFQNLIQTDIKTPVFERVNREETTLEGRFTGRRIQENENIDYKETRSDYLAVGEGRKPEENSRSNNIVNYPQALQETKESKETRRMMTGGANIRNNQRDIGSFKKSMDIESEEIDETRKYVNRGDYR
jgi:hypothetical protein|tara:strand:+ start:629 stop:1192 length:564 start_codon:yes stop_codon:yes gene_type:complete